MKNCLSSYVYILNKSTILYTFETPVVFNSSINILPVSNNLLNFGHDKSMKFSNFDITAA